MVVRLKHLSYVLVEEISPYYPCWAIIRKLLQDMYLGVVRINIRCRCLSSRAVEQRYGLALPVLKGSRCELLECYADVDCILLNAAHVSFSRTQARHSSYNGVKVSLLTNLYTLIYS